MTTLADLANLKVLVDTPRKGYNILGLPEGDSEDAELKRANTESLIATREAQLLQRSVMNEANIRDREAAADRRNTEAAQRNLLNEQRTALVKEQAGKAEVVKKQAEAIEAAAAQARAWFTPGPNKEPATIWGNLDRAVVEENTRRIKSLKVPMSPRETFEFQRKALAPIVEGLETAATKDPAYRAIQSQFANSPEYMAFSAQKRPEDPGMIRRYVGDTVTNVASGLPALAGGAVGVAGSFMPVGEIKEKFLAAGRTASSWAEDIQKKLGSSDLKGRQQLLSEAQGFLGVLGVAVDEPMLVLDVLAQSAAGGLGAGLAAKGALKAASFAGATGRAATLGSLAVGSAAVGGVSSASDALKEAAKVGLVGEGRDDAIQNAALRGGAIGAAGGVFGTERAFARLLGIKVPTGSIKDAAPRAAGAGGAVGSVAKTVGKVGVAAGEESLEEGGQGAQGAAAVKEQMGGTTLMDYFDSKSAALGLLAGGATRSLSVPFDRRTANDGTTPPGDPIGVAPNLGAVGGVEAVGPTATVAAQNAAAIELALRDVSSGRELGQELSSAVSRLVAPGATLEGDAAQARVAEVLARVGEAADLNIDLAARRSDLAPDAREADIVAGYKQVYSSTVRATLAQTGVTEGVTRAVTADVTAALAEFSGEQPPAVRALVEAEIQQLAETAAEGGIRLADLVGLADPKKQQALVDRISASVKESLPFQVSLLRGSRESGTAPAPIFAANPDENQAVPELAGLISDGKAAATRRATQQRLDIAVAQEGGRREARTVALAEAGGDAAIREITAAIVNPLRGKKPRSKNGSADENSARLAQTRRAVADVVETYIVENDISAAQLAAPGGAKSLATAILNDSALKQKIRTRAKKPLPAPVASARVASAPVAPAPVAPAPVAPAGPTEAEIAAEQRSLINEAYVSPNQAAIGQAAELYLGLDTKARYPITLTFPHISPDVLRKIIANPSIVSGPVTLNPVAVAPAPVAPAQGGEITRTFADEFAPASNPPIESAAANLVSRAAPEVAATTKGKSETNPPAASRETPRRGSRTQRSVGAEATGNTAANVRSALETLLGGPIGKLLPKVNVITAGSMPRDARSASQDAFGVVQGYLDPKTGQIVLVADNIPPGEEMAVLLHEVFHKQGRTVFGDKYARFVGAVSGWGTMAPTTQERQIYNAAVTRFGRDLDGAFADELVPYAIEEAIRAGVQPTPGPATTLGGWLKQISDAFTSWFKAWTGGSLTPTQLLDAAYTALSQEIESGGRAEITPEKVEAGVKKFLDDVAYGVSNSRVGRDLRNVTMKGRLGEAAQLARPTFERAIELFQRGGTTFTTLRLLFDKGPTGLLGGMSKDVQNLLERKNGATQTKLSEVARVLNKLSSLPAKEMTEALDIYTKLTSSGEDAQGYNPTTAPQTQQEIGLRDRFNALSPRQRRAILDTERYLRAQYTEHITSLDAALEQESKMRGLSPEIEKIRSQFARVKFYGPLGTEGRYVLRGVKIDDVAINPDTTGMTPERAAAVTREARAEAIRNAKTEFFVRSNSLVELQRIQEETLNDPGSVGLTFGAVYTMPDFNEERGLRPEGRLRDATLDAIDGMETLSPALKQQLAMEVMRTYYSESASAMDKRRIQRTGVQGPTVSYQGLGAYMNTMAFATTNATFHAELQTMKDRLRFEGETRGGRASILANTLLEHVTLNETPVVSGSFTRNFLNASYMWAMSFTPAVALWQLTSLATNTIPYLNAETTKGRELGVGTSVDIGASMMEVVKDRGWVAASRNEDPKDATTPFTARELELYNLRLKLMARGRLHDDVMRGALDEMYSNRMMVKLKDWGSFFQNRSEQLVVGTAAIAAYDASKRANPAADENTHLEFAIETLNVTQPSSAQFDRPILSKSTNFGKVAYLLKTYPIAVLGQMASDIRDIATLKGDDRAIALNKMVTQTSIMVMLGGAAASPVAMALIGLTGLLSEMGEDDEDKDPARAKLNLRDRFVAGIRESSGEEAASIARRGLVPFLDASGSTELSPFVLRMPEEVFSMKGAADIVGQLFGPLYSSMNRASNGTPVAEDWRNWMAWLPRSGQSVAQVAGWANNEFKDISRKGEFITGVTSVDVVLRLLGFQPRAVQEAREKEGLPKRIARKMTEERDFLLDTIIITRAAGEDPSVILEEHNRLHAKYPKFQITEAQITERTKSRDAKSAEDREPNKRLQSLGITPAVLGFQPT